MIKLWWMQRSDKLQLLQHLLKEEAHGQEMKFAGAGLEQATTQLTIGQAMANCKCLTHIGGFI